ncbi:hypothetical protein [Deinococcus kurensis]|uniref:hypothetical protein n=1 Tax=Deinococcus kurensis TaxID=2662757 RepID=UPI0012D2EF68|nr:hypothetical protein [Deinococcus kurensis]
MTAPYHRHLTLHAVLLGLTQESTQDIPQRQVMNAQLQDVIGVHPGVPFTAATISRVERSTELALIAVHLDLKADVPDAGTPEADELLGLLRHWLGVALNPDPQRQILVMNSMLLIQSATGAALIRE